MTITATADAAFSPPRVEVEVSVPVGDVMTSVSVWRNDSTGRSLVRSQPSAGFESRTVFDYECPYGQNVTYDWAAEYYDPTLNVTTFSEPWTTFPGSWTGDTAAGSISSNVLTLAAGIGVTKTISRTGLTANWTVIEIASIAARFGSLLTLNFSTGSPITMYTEPSGDTLVVNGSGTASSILGINPFTITRTDTGFVVTQGVNSANFLGVRSDTLTSITFRFTGGILSEVNGSVGAITAEGLGGPLDTIAESSTAVDLNPADAWFVAPQAPALSFPLSNSNQQAAGIRELAPLTNATNTTVHRILGTSTPVTTTTGNRQGDVLAATVYTHTSEERQALRALLNPETPILINVPSSWDLELEYGFYQVGDVTETRPYTLGGIPMRDFTLPLTKVRSPEVDVENPGWSYAQVATTWTTYTDLLTNYTTYADLAVDNRS